jgi:hypothetical protein
MDGGKVTLQPGRFNRKSAKGYNDLPLGSLLDWQRPHDHLEAPAFQRTIRAARRVVGEFLGSAEEERAGRPSFDQRIRGCAAKRAAGKAALVNN